MEQKERKKGMVRVRGGFSDVSGIAPCNRILQFDEFDDPTRVLISNNLYALTQAHIETKHGYELKEDIRNRSTSFCLEIQRRVFCERATVPEIIHYLDWRKIFNRIHDVIMNACYNEVLDVVQFICQYLEEEDKKFSLVYEAMNSVFEAEFVGYRFVNKEIVPITNVQELSEIETACQNPYDGCRKQIQNAVGMLADREKKDYKNCIKESISAVESMCQIIVGNNSATLGQALKQLEKCGTSINPQLKVAFEKLYSYTNSEGGIRHAEGAFESNVTFEEAKFMLVACSAFVNYLIAEYGKGSN